MIKSLPTHRSLALASAIGLATVAVATGPVSAQDRAAKPSPPAAAAKAGPRMERQSGVWVEGPGFNITYGGTYESCAQKCLANPKCLMIEYYRPEKKCNLYDALRPRLKGGSSDVGIKG